MNKYGIKLILLDLGRVTGTELEHSIAGAFTGALLYVKPQEAYS